MRTFLDRLFDTFSQKIKRQPLTTFATIFVAIVCCALIAGHSLRTWKAHTRDLRVGQTAVDNLARALSQHATDAIIKADTHLTSLIERVEESGAGPLQMARLNKAINTLEAKLAETNRILVIDEHGGVLLSSLDTDAKKAHFSDRAYFQFHRLHDTQELHISPPVQSRLNGDWIITVSRRMNHADGRFAGVMAAVLTMDYFQQFYASFDIGNAGLIRMISDDGTVLARRPFNAAILGTSIENIPLYRDQLSKVVSGSGTMASTVDGVERIYAFRHLERFPIIVIAGLSKDEVLSGWRNSAIQHSINVAILVLIISWVGIHFVRQIKNLSQLKDALQQSQAELRSLSSHQENIKEKERIRIARDIHDDLGQNLLALKMDVSMLQARTAGSHLKLHERARLALQNIDATIVSVKSIINDLRPATLDLGLYAAVEWQLKQFESASGIACKLIGPDVDYGLDDEQTAAVFRILQESLNNISKHSKATTLEVFLSKTGHCFSMSVTDNGIGITSSDRRKINAFGLIGIKERVQSLAGELVVDGGSGAGTIVTVTLYLQLA